MLLSPLLLAIAIAIKLEDGGPIFFLQRRVGKHGQVFGMLKFRTMSQGAEQRGYDMIEGLPIEDAVRELKTCSAEMHATRVGRRLRRHSLDELPSSGMSFAAIWGSWGHDQCPNTKLRPCIRGKRASGIRCDRESPASGRYQAEIGSAGKSACTSTLSTHATGP